MVRELRSGLQCLLVCAQASAARGANPARTRCGRRPASEHQHRHWGGPHCGSGRLRLLRHRSRGSASGGTQIQAHFHRATAAPRPQAGAGMCASGGNPQPRLQVPKVAPKTIHYGRDAGVDMETRLLVKVTPPCAYALCSWVSFPACAPLGGALTSHLLFEPGQGGWDKADEAAATASGSRYGATSSEHQRASAGAAAAAAAASGGERFTGNIPGPGPGQG